MNINEEKFQTYAALQGFDIRGFDAWLPNIKGTGAFDELTERRQAAIDAIKNEDSFLRHLEWMLVRWQSITRSDARERWVALGKKQTADRSKGGKLRAKKEADKMQPHWDAWERALMSAALKAYSEGQYNPENKRWKRNAVDSIYSKARQWLKVNDEAALKATHRVAPINVWRKVHKEVTKKQ